MMEERQRLITEIERLRAALVEILVDGRSIEVAQVIAEEALGDE